MNPNNKYKEVKAKDLDVTPYTKRKYNWDLSVGSNSTIRVYGNLTIDDDLDLDQSAQEVGYAGIVMTGDLKVNGCIKNLDGDTGLSLCVAGETTARTLLGGGGMILLNSAKIENLTVGHYNGGMLLIERLATKVLMNFDHYTKVTNTDDVQMSIGSEMMIGGGQAKIYQDELLEYWYKNNIFKAFIEYEKVVVDEEDSGYYYLSNRDFLRTLTAENEQVVIHELESYINNSNLRAADLELPGNLDTDCIDVTWNDGKVTAITIGSQYGLKILGDAIRSKCLQKLKILEIKDVENEQLPESFRHIKTVTKLMIQKCVMEEFPSWIRNLTKLESLVLDENNISEIPDWIGELTHIKEFELSSSKISELPKGLFTLENLESLNVCNNKIKIVPTEIGALNKLKDLSLTGNQLNTLPASFVELSGLEALRLGTNKFTVIPGQVIALRKLKEFSLCNSNVTKFSEEILQMEQLEILDLSFNQITEIPDRISDLESLRELRLGHNKLISLPDEMGELSELEELILTNNQLTVIPEWIKGLDELSCLHLDINYISKLPRWIKDHERLDEFYIKGNNIKKLPSAIKSKFELMDEEELNRKELMGYFRIAESMGLLSTDEEEMEDEFGSCYLEYLEQKGDDNM